MEERISVIVPVYNVEKYLDRCIKSICGQTYKNLEIILVDDGSTDLSGMICDDQKKSDQRIRVIHKKNGGLSDARNAGLEIATGDYIGFVDSDDWIESDMYDSLLTAVKEHNVRLAITGINRIYDNGYEIDQFTRKMPIEYVGTDIIRRYLLQDSFSTAAWDKLYHRSLFKNRRFPKGKLYEDAPVIFDILCEIEKAIVLGKPHYHYFQRSDSICGQAFSEKKMDHYEFSKDIQRRVKEEYPTLSKEADVFLGCKLCELIYSLKESTNSELFKNEEEIIKRDFKKVKNSVIFNPEVPKILRMKAALVVLCMTDIYIKVKSKRVKKGN